MIPALAVVAPQLKALEPLLIEYLLTPNEPTNQVLRHIFSAGGKRVRPALFLLVSQMLGYEGEHRYPIASVCEYIHTASLLHDDVIDNSTLRRGKPTVNSIWGDQTSVLAGDLIYSASCRLMVKTASLELIDTFAECIRFMSESELFQLELLWNPETSEEHYNRVLSGKTAALFEASCKTPAFLTKAPAHISDALGEFGKAVGFAFQIADDCLDYEGEAQEVGKSLVADLLEGKVTLPVILGMQDAVRGSELKHVVKSILTTGTTNENQKTQLVNLVIESGGLQSAKTVAINYSETAIAALRKVVPFCPQTAANIDAMEALASVAHFVVNRKN